jgi:hypothetical protein
MNNSGPMGPPPGAPRAKRAVAGGRGDGGGAPRQASGRAGLICTGRPATILRPESFILICANFVAQTLARLAGRSRGRRSAETTRHNPGAGSSGLFLRIISRPDESAPASGRMITAVRGPGATCCCRRRQSSNIHGLAVGAAAATPTGSCHCSLWLRSRTFSNITLGAVSITPRSPIRLSDGPEGRQRSRLVPVK